MPSEQHETSLALNKAREVIMDGHHLLIAVDSNAFFEGVGQDRHVNFNRPWMGQFRGLASRGEQMVMAAVWDVEVRRHFMRSIASQVTIKLPRLSRIASSGEMVAALHDKANELRQAAQHLVEQEWDEVKRSLNVQVVEVPEDRCLARRVFDLWSGSMWPFENRREKRDEFQDALALLSLEKHTMHGPDRTRAPQLYLLVVTNDFGCRKFCESTEFLIPCADIDAVVDFISRRDVYIDWAQRSVQLSAELGGDKHHLVRPLQDALAASINGTFPPHKFSFTVDGRKRSGWLRDYVLQSVALLAVGPRESLVEVIQVDHDATSFRGRARFNLLVNLNAPRYEPHTACPSQDIVVEDLNCCFDLDFWGTFHKDFMWSASLMSEVPEHLVVIPDCKL